MRKESIVDVKLSLCMIEILLIRVAQREELCNRPSGGRLVSIFVHALFRAEVCSNFTRDQIVQRRKHL